jgi:hypothetical protein
MSPQFQHVVYDPFFTMVPTMGGPKLVNVDRINLNNLLSIGGGHHEFNQIKEYDKPGDTKPAPELHPEWLKETCQHHRE